MKVFLDTNILVYTLDPRDPAKQAKARRAIASGKEFAVSTQVLQELYVTAVSKCSIQPLRAKQLLRTFDWADLVTVTPALIDDAIDLQILNEISFWDSLILAAAVSARCSVLWTEDLNPGQIVAGIRIENPLR
jgi:predicted nucleic acid-binding protein